MSYAIIDENFRGIDTTFSDGDSLLVLTAPWTSGLYKIITSGLCDADTSSFELTLTELPAPVIRPVERCGPGPVLLVVWHANERHSYEWFDELGVIHAGSQLEIPWIGKTKKYNVRATDQLTGCKSKFAEASIIIHPVDSIIVVNQAGHLVASANPPMEWFYAGQKLPDKGNTLKMLGDGEYRVRKHTFGKECPAEGVFTTKGVERAGMDLYPNPADNNLRFVNRPDAILKDIINVTGTSVFYLCDLDCSGDECRLDVSSLSPGAYFLNFDEQGRHFYIRVFVY